MDPQELSKTKKPRKRRLTRAERLAQRIAGALQGGASPIHVKVSLTGAAADAWQSLRDAAEGLSTSDTDIVTALLVEAAVTVRAALRQIPRRL